FSDEQIQSFDYSLKNISESNNIIFVCIIPRNEDKKVDARTKLFKTIAKYSNIKDFPEYREYDKELIKYVSDMVKKKDLIADSKTISYLINYCGVNLRIIDTQLEKIAVTIYPNRQFSKMDIEENCNLQEDVFSLADLIILNDKNALMKQFAQIIDKKNPLEIIGLLNSNLHKLLYLKTYENNKSLQELSNDLKIPEYPIKILLEKIKNKTHTELSILKHDLAEAEIKIKTGTTLNPEYLLESVLLCGGQNV
ncbi:hypothetical protein IJG14_05900, partial [bacterium]|nr:hypothetical protein [bacterium]